MAPSGRVEKQTRVLLACDSCRRRKIRCDSAHPSCGNCAKLKLECVYTPSAKQATVGSRYNSIEGRLEKLEDLMRRVSEQISGLVNENEPGSQSNDGPSAYDSNSIESGKDGDDSEDDKDQIDCNLLPVVPIFNDRLAHLKAHTSGNEESCTVYTSGVFLSIFSPADINSLAMRLNDAALTRRLEAASSKIWRVNQSVIARLLEPPPEGQLNRDFMIYCMKAYEDCCVKSTFLPLMLLPTELLEPNWSQLPEFVQQGLLAAVALMGIADMKLSGDNMGYDTEFIDTERRIAFHMAIRSLNLMRFARPSAAVVRMSLLVLWLLCAFSTIPSLIHFMGPIIEMAKGNGLDKPELNARFPPEERTRRNLLWVALEVFQHSVAICQSRRAWCTFEGRNPLEFGDEQMAERFARPIDVPGGVDDLWEFTQARELEYIYDRSRESLFSLHNNSSSPLKVSRDIRTFHNDLESWYSKNLSRLSGNIHMIGRFTRFPNWLLLFSRGNAMCVYYQTQLIVHSIPAFYPSYLPETLEVDSLHIVARAARNLLAHAIAAQRRKGSCTYSLGAAVTAAVGTLLYKQICYPEHPDNASDLDTALNNIRNFVNDTWPYHGIDDPMAEIWKVLVDIMNGLYQRTYHPQPPSQMQIKQIQQAHQAELSPLDICALSSTSEPPTSSTVSDTPPTAASSVESFEDGGSSSTVPSQCIYAASRGHTSNVRDMVTEKPREAMSPLLDELDSFLPEDLVAVKNDGCVIS